VTVNWRTAGSPAPLALAGEVALAELAVEQLHDKAVAVPSQRWVVAGALVAQKGVLCVELVPLVEDAGLFEAVADPDAAFERDMRVLRYAGPRHHRQPRNRPTAKSRGWPLSASSRC
jgi:hypothetical protein